MEEREDGFSHAEIGAYLLGLWGLPYTVVEAVALHHGPNRVPHQNFDAISAVYAANLLAHELEEESAGDSKIYRLDDYQEDLASLDAWDLIPEFRGLAKEFTSTPVEV